MSTKEEKNRKMKLAGQWIANGSHGSSSLTMCAVYLGTKPTDPAHPHDADDFSRCLAFVDAVLEKSPHWMRGVSPQWDAIVERWNDLVLLFHYGNCCYKLLDEITHLHD